MSPTASTTTTVYYRNPDGSLAFRESSDTVDVIGGEIEEDATVITKALYDAAVDDIDVRVAESTAALIADAEVEQRAIDDARTPTLKAIATAAGVTVDQIKEALG